VLLEHPARSGTAAAPKPAARNPRLLSDLLLIAISLTTSLS
jgi:hypothetical protein